MKMVRVDDICNLCTFYFHGECTIEDCECLVKSIEIVDAEPVKHGQWKFKNNGRYGQTRCYCTACGKHSGIGGIRENQMKPYCPNCGAKMDGGNDDH